MRSNAPRSRRPAPRYPSMSRTGSTSITWKPWSRVIPGTSGNCGSSATRNACWSSWPSGVCAAPVSCLAGWPKNVPGLVRRIAAAGHELASHGYGHQPLYALSPAAFREDVKRGVGLLEAAAGQKVRGYRAPSFSITDWALDVLKELGLEYDSSAFPTAAHDRYGRLSSVDGSEGIVEVRPGLYEIFVSTLRIGHLGVPWAGGGYFRLLPYRLFAHGIRRILSSGRPYVFYIHPWEIDPGQPRVQGLKPAHRVPPLQQLGPRRAEIRAPARRFPVDDRRRSTEPPIWRAGHRRRGTIESGSAGDHRPEPIPRGSAACRLRPSDLAAEDRDVPLSAVRGRLARSPPTTLFQG